jgi:four helix bundle protein
LKDYKKLMVWEKAHKLALAVYGATSNFPRDELFESNTQIRRACVSIPANIAVGCGIEGDAELARFFQISMGSTSELEYHLLLAHNLGILNDSLYSELNSRISEVRRMLNAFIQKLKAKR